MTESPDVRSPTSIPGRDVAWPPGVMIVALLSAPFLGALLGFVLLNAVVIPRIGYGGVNRIVSLGAHLTSPYTRPTAVCLGNSVTIEGVDATLVERAAGTDVSVENLAIAGAHAAELRVQAPLVAAARPALVVITLLPEAAAAPQDLDLDKAYAYGIGGFAIDDPCSRIESLSEKTCSALSAAGWRAALRMRTTPIQRINSAVRARLNPAVSTRRENNWTAPFLRHGSISGLRLQRHISEMRDTWLALQNDDNDSGPAETIALAKEFTSRGVPVLMVVAPVHPDLLPGFEPWAESLVESLRGLAATNPDVAVADASTLLGADLFSDALHPNEDGRSVFSAFLGAQIREFFQRSRGVSG